MTDSPVVYLQVGLRLSVMMIHSAVSAVQAVLCVRGLSFYVVARGRATCPFSSLNIFYRPPF